MNSSKIDGRCEETAVVASRLLQNKIEKKGVLINSNTARQ